MILKPFEHSSPFKFEVNIEKNEEFLIIKYYWKNSSELLFPPSENIPQRKHNLWKETCLEFFLLNEEKGEYLEFNFSPNQDWNCYHFLSYRKGMSEYSIVQPIFKMTENSLEVRIELNGIDFQQYSSIQISVVAKDKQQRIHYYALNHPTQKPDFHNTDHFQKISDLFCQTTNK